MKNKLTALAAATLLTFGFSIAALGQEPCRGEGSVRSITKAASGGFETVTFEVNGSKLPEVVDVSDEKLPVENYGGENLHLRGPYVKSVLLRLVPWMCNIRENLRARTSTITGIKQMEQFEGHVQYAIGYTIRAKYVGVTKIKGTKTSKVIVKFRR